MEALALLAAAVKPTLFMNKNIKIKHGIYLVVLFIIFVIILDVVTRVTVDQLPERNEAEKFVQQHATIKNIFGNNIKVEYSKKGSKVTSWSDGRTDFVFRFKVTGDKKTGYVSAFGEKREENKFQVFKIFSSNDFEQRKIIWQQVKI